MQRSIPKLVWQHVLEQADEYGFISDGLTKQEAYQAAIDQDGLCYLSGVELMYFAACTLVMENPENGLVPGNVFWITSNLGRNYWEDEFCFEPLDEFRKFLLSKYIKFENNVSQAHYRRTRFKGSKLTPSDLQKPYVDEIDPDIATLIRDLNNHGYRTKYSCQGKKSQDDVVNYDHCDYAYIMFNDPQIVLNRLDQIFELGLDVGMREFNSISASQGGDQSYEEIFEKNKGFESKIRQLFGL